MRYFLLLTTATLWAAPPQDAKSVLQRALDVTSFSSKAGVVVHWHDMQGVEQDYQSPPPFITIPSSREAWFDPQTGVERSSAVSIFPGSAPSAPSVSLYTRGGVFAIGADGPVARPGSTGAQRNLNLWAVLGDWRDAKDVRAIDDRVYADYPRTVLARAGEFGEERLFFDKKSGFPVKLERDEPHYLWGQLRAEFTYTLWRLKDGIMFPTAVARVVDGFKEITRTIGDFEFIDRAQAPDLSVPAVAPAGPVPLFLQPLPPRKIEVGPRTFLSSNTGYNEAITLIDGTVYVLEATQGEGRAKQDLEMIHAAFPGPHPIVVVVSDLAWPHIAGMRFWAAQGATVISHRASKNFLTRVIDRRWTAAPDALERSRNAALPGRMRPGRVALRFVDKEMSLAGGKLRLIAIDGVESEGALMAYLADDGLLWASDYIQSVTRPATYTTEVWQAVHRSGIAPKKVAAMHIPLTDWSQIESLAAVR
jgi:hypothetical protein